MPILDMQQRAREIGRIRLGTSVLQPNGKKRAVKLDAFRFTSPSEYAIRRVAEVLGGDPQPWEDTGRQQWQVFTGATEIPVAVPPGQAVSQWWELWSGGGWVRRCDGHTESLKQQSCLCPADLGDRVDAAKGGRACKPTTRVSVIVPDLPDVGVWRIESHGINAALELAGATQILDGLRQAGQIVPAVLRAEAREQRYIDPATDKPETRKFVVPVLEIRRTLRELTELAARPLADSLPDRPAGLAIEAAPAPGRRRDITTAQDAAAEIETAAGRSALLALWKTVAAKGWADDYVHVPWDEALVTVRTAFEHRGAEIGPQS